MATANIQAVITADDRASSVVQGFSKNVERSADDFASSMKKAGLALTAIGIGVTAFAKNSTDYLTDLTQSSKQLSRETGSTVEESSRLLAVTKRLGVDVQEASVTFGILSKKIADSRSSTSEAALAQKDLQNKIEKTKIEISQTTNEINRNGDSTGELRNKIKGLNIDLEQYSAQLSATSNPLDKLHVATKNADGSARSFNDILLDVADKFKVLPDGADKTSLAMELFGRSGKDLLPILNLGSEGIKDLENQADKLGLTLNSKTIGSVNRYIESQKKLKDSTDAIKMAVGNLTAPILTEFNIRISDLATRMLNTNGAMKGFLANILAFGGPIFTATGAMVGFVGAVVQAWPAITAFAAALTGPVGLAIIGITAAVAGLTFAYLELTGKTNELKLAHDRVKASQDAVKTSSDQLATAQLGAEGAALSVERAQNLYNDAVARYGPNSLEAREANLRLREALDQKKDAENRARDAVNQMKDAESQYARDKQFEQAIAEKKGQVHGLQGLINSLTEDIRGMTNINVPSGGGLQQRLRNAFRGGFASGGFTGRGGENEVAGVVHRGEYVIPKSAVDQNTGMPKVEVPNSASTVNITLQVGAFMGSQQDARKYAELIMNAYKDLQASRGVMV